MPKLVHSKVFITGIVLTIFLSWGGILPAQTNPLGFSLSGTSVTEKDTFVVALKADSVLTGSSVYAYRFYLSYSPSYFEYIGADGTGPVLSTWGMPVLNDSNQGTLVMAGAGTSPLSGSGDMLYLKFVSLRSGYSTISFNTSESYLNEGNPASVYSNVTIYSAALSYPDIYPDYRDMYVGDEVKMTVSGGTAPYVYTSDNHAVAVITNTDTLRAVGPGTTRVRVTDSKGEVSVTSGQIDVRAIKMELGEVSVWPQDTFYMPVRIQIAPGTSVYSGRFDLTFNSNLTALPDAILPGDFTPTLQKNIKPGVLSLSFASASPITGNGVLCYLPFRANNSGYQYVSFDNMQFNESLLAWTTKSSYLYIVKTLPVLSMVPNSGTMMWGDVQKISVSNGTAPYSWSVSDTALASIDLQGNLSAKTGGEVRVSATDDNGATVTSGIFRIADNTVTVFDAEGTLDTETRVPLVTSSLPPGKSIFSYKANVSFDDNYLEFLRAESAGGSDLVQASLSGNSVTAAAALGSGTGSGVIGFLVFRIKNTLALNASSNITLNSFTANENSLISVTQNGSVTRVEQTSYRPIAVAGMDFTVTEGSTGQLDGSASFDLDNNPLTYHWTAPAGIILSDTTSATPEFSAPYVDKDTNYTFILVVNDGTSDSDPSEVHVTVKQVNFPPVADAGPNMNYVEGSSVSLDGSKSYDPDSDALSYKWTSLDGVVLFNPTSVSPSFILPQVTVNTDYRFKLVVNDGALNSTADTVTITAIQVNKKPVAFAGGDFSVNENEQASLDGSLSYDADNDPLSYTWTAPVQVTLSSTTAAKPTFTAPPVLRDSVLTFKLVVNDGTKDSDPDYVKVTVVNLDVLKTGTSIDSVMSAQIDSFDIDSTAATVTLYVPYGSDVRTLSPDFTLSEGATIYPGGGSVQDLSMPVYYQVTAEDGTTGRMWKVEVYRPLRNMQRTLDAGWNWISLNVSPPDISVNAIFGGLNLSDLDYIKSSEYSSVYYSATGWFGNLSEFPRNRVVRFKKGIAGDLTVQGQEINPVITPVQVMEGWNDIAYLLNSDAPVNGAILASSLPSGDVVLKGKNGSAVWYPGTGWAGELDTLRVLHGYKMHVQSTASLLYNASGSSRKSADIRNAGHEELLRKYNLDPGNFEYSATLIAEVVTADGQDPADNEALIMALRGDEVRGISRAAFIPVLGKYVFIVTYFSNEEDQDISFRIKFSGRDTWYQADLVKKFNRDEITGKALNPYPLLVDAKGLTRNNVRPGVIALYPNPVSDKLTIQCEENINRISLYDISGKKLIEKTSPDKELSVTISMNHLDPGLYTLKVETSERVYTRKIIKTSY